MVDKIVKAIVGLFGGSAAAGGAEGRAEGDGDAAHAGTDRRGQ